MANVTKNQADYCREIASKLEAAGYHVEWLRNEKNQLQIRQQPNTVSLIESLSTIRETRKQVAVRHKTELGFFGMSLNSLHYCSKGSPAPSSIINFL